jgi:arylsulfatase A-like enzyme
VAWLEQAATRDEPWVLQCSFPDPHHPFTPPGRWWEAYDPKEMPVSQSFDDPLDQAPEHLRLIRSFGPGPNPVQFFGPTRDMVQHALAAEFGMLEMIDDAVGSVFGALERLGMADDTIVVFTSDHGDMFGDHGLMLKGTMQYQGCLRVPLVIARPGGAPARSSSLAASMDLAQTLLELCGVTPFDNMQGHSLVPILDDPAASVRDYVLIEEDFPPAARMRRFPSHIRTVIGEAGRITRYATGELEVFDLEADPAELVNLANRPEGRERRAQLGELLAEALVDHSDLARSAPLTTSAAVAR